MAWIEKFIARIKALTTGRYRIILSIYPDGQADWTFTGPEKIEKASK